MIRTNSLFRVLFVLALVCAGVVYAQDRPTNGVNGKIHPNLYNANVNIINAFNLLTVAQQQNDFDMQGHAVNAKNLLIQASKEVNAAGVAAGK